MFTAWRRESRIRQLLRGLGRQRVVTILQPGNVLLVEQAPDLEEGDDAALLTCELRGWVERYHEGVPHAKIPADWSIPDLSKAPRGPVYRLTSAGWTALWRTDLWVLAAFLVSVLSLVVGVAVFLR